MKKLYLTSFTFTTGTELSFTEVRLVVINRKEIEDYKRKSNISYEYDPGLYAAQEKAANWFVKNYPNSKAISISSYPAIEDDMEQDFCKEGNATETSDGFRISFWSK